LFVQNVSKILDKLTGEEFFCEVETNSLGKKRDVE